MVAPINASLVLASYRAGDGGALGKAGVRMEQQHSKRDARRLPKLGQEVNHKVFGSRP